VGQQHLQVAAVEDVAHVLAVHRDRYATTVSCPDGLSYVFDTITVVPRSRRRPRCLD
jgi:hypothetical protein